VQCLIKHRLEGEPRLVVLYEAIVESLGSIIDLHTDLTYKHYLIIELITASSKRPEIKLERLVKVILGNDMLMVHYCIYIYIIRYFLLLITGLSEKSVIIIGLFHIVR